MELYELIGKKIRAYKFEIAASLFVLYGLTGASILTNDFIMHRKLAKDTYWIRHTEYNGKNHSFYGYETNGDSITDKVIGVNNTQPFKNNKSTFNLNSDYIKQLMDNNNLK